MTQPNMSGVRLAVYRAIVAAGAPIGKREVVEATGAGPYYVSACLTHLYRLGLIGPTYAAGPGARWATHAAASALRAKFGSAEARRLRANKCARERYKRNRLDSMSPAKRIMALLAERGAPVSARVIAHDLGLSRSVVSSHLRQLRNGGQADYAERGPYSTWTTGDAAARWRASADEAKAEARQRRNARQYALAIERAELAVVQRWISPGQWASEGRRQTWHP